MACILDRPRHAELIEQTREAGARDHADLRRRRGRRDGDLQPGKRRRYLFGSGGAPEGVLAAAALRCIGGQIQGRLVFRNDDERARADRCGITDLARKYDDSNWRPAT